MCSDSLSARLKTFLLTDINILHFSTNLERGKLGGGTPKRSSERTGVTIGHALVRRGVAPQRILRY